MKRKALMLLIAFVALIAGCSAVQPIKPTVVERRIGDRMTGYVDWGRKVVYAVGDGIMPPYAVSPAQARVRAKRAAMDTAYGRLLETVQSVRVDSESTTLDYSNTNHSVTIRVRGLVKNAEIEEIRHFEDGSYQVMLRMPLDGSNGLSSALLPIHAEKVRRNRKGYEISRIKSNTFTGLIIDARGLGFRPVLYPRVLAEDGRPVYDLSLVDPNVALQEGLVDYRKSAGHANETVRAGTNPLMVRAIEVNGKQKSDIIVSKTDADRIYQVGNGRILTDGYVVILID